MKKLLLSISLLLTSLSLIAGDVTAASYRYGYGMQFVPNTGRTWFWNPSRNPSFYCLYKVTRNGNNTNIIVTPITPVAGNLEIGKLYIFRLIFDTGYDLNMNNSFPQSPLCLEYNNGIWNSILLPCPPMPFFDDRIHYTYGTDYKIQMLTNGPVAFLIKNYVVRAIDAHTNQDIINGLGPVTQYLP